LTQGRIMVKMYPNSLDPVAMPPAVPIYWLHSYGQSYLARKMYTTCWSWEFATQKL